MKRPIIATNEIYHIYNRGVEKRKLFLDDEDRFRFIHDLFEFNDINPVPNLTYFERSEKQGSAERSEAGSYFYRILNNHLEFSGMVF